MKQFTIRLHEQATRPIMMLHHNMPLNAMLDTGSMFPVWVGTETLLQKIGGEFVANDVPFGGFGGMTKGNLYKGRDFCREKEVNPSWKKIA